jgi:hypothetical protein
MQPYFDKRPIKSSRKATKQGQRAAIKGCMIKGGHLSPQNKGKEQPKGYKKGHKCSRLF